MEKLSQHSKGIIFQIRIKKNFDFFEKKHIFAIVEKHRDN